MINTIKIFARGSNEQFAAVFPYSLYQLALRHMTNACHAAGGHGG